MSATINARIASTPRLVLPVKPVAAAATVQRQRLPNGVHIPETPLQAGQSVQRREVTHNPMARQDGGGSRAAFVVAALPFVAVVLHWLFG